MEISPERKHLLTQVLEFWYTTDFMTQGALKTEKTREEKEIYSYVMKNPTKFSILCQHDFLNTGENILTKINSLETLLESKKKQENEKAGKKSLETQNPSDRCCHGRITVYVGSINRAYLSNRIAYQLGCELPNNPSADRVALASFQLSDEGTLIVDSLSLSPILWAIRRISEKSSDDTMYKVLDPEIYKEDQTKFFSHEEPPSCDYDKLQIFAHRIIENTVVSIKADVDEAEVSSEIHYRYSIYCNSSEKTKRETDEYSSLSMSFYSDDLKRFKETIECDKWLENNDMWNALIDYICAPYDMLHGNHNPLQKDLSILAFQNSSTSSATRKAIKDILRVDRSPWGKWPSKYRPFLMQQVAINIAINTNKPFFSVHGPPGTGKTTLLCELVAENVVQRAVMLSRFERPDDLFKSEQLQISGRSVTYYSFLDKYKDIRKYGLVVASSNNAAVENITRQLPLIENLDKKLRGSDSPQIESIRNLFSLDHAKSEVVERPNYEKEDRPQEPVKLQDIYFSSYASELMRAPCWGLLGAALGKKGNVVRFYKKVLKQIYWDFYHKNEGFCTNRITQYTEARRFFKKQYDIVKELRAELQKQVDHAESENQIKHGHGEDEFICITDAFFDDLSSKNDVQKREKAQMTNPRLSLHYDREREKLFHASLILTKEFILSSDACRKNFHLLGCVWGLESFDNPFKTANSQHKSETFQKCTTYLIQTLQLLVPVISTTFASAGRFFKDVKKADALGTILVDEAGQVRPQMALRLFSKASKAIVVGDPNQIDPIVTDELGFLESKLARDIGEAYSDRTLSVQKIADYLSPFGGTQCDSYKFKSQKRTGVPLYVHSRCIEPMFSISNRLSYGNAMLCITSQPSQSLKDSFCYQTSQWINVSGKEDRKKNHFIRPQGHRVLQLLETAFKKMHVKQTRIVKNQAQIFSL